VLALLTDCRRLEVDPGIKLRAFTGPSWRERRAALAYLKQNTSFLPCQRGCRVGTANYPKGLPSMACPSARELVKHAIFALQERGSRCSAVASMIEPVDLFPPRAFSRGAD